jgi:two-component system, sensor histidine kinase PdtaS
MEKFSHITRFGLPGIDRVPFGTHACHVYRNYDELVAALVPYFVVGLRSNERCLWVTAPPLLAREAYQVLRPHGIDDAIRAGRLLILDFGEWYASSAGLKGQDVVELSLKEEERALAEGYYGLRIAGNMSFLKPADWSTFMEYEEAASARFVNRRIVALCSYALAQCHDRQIDEVRNAHHCSLQGSKTDGQWVALTCDRSLCFDAQTTEQGSN